MPVALTVDVEDWYDGMAELGHPIERPPGARSGLETLIDLLSKAPGRNRVTLFVVGNYAEWVRQPLEELAAAGHEVASHGPDHGALPASRPALEEWMRRGRETLEDLLQRPVKGFRSPRFDVPSGMGLSEYREAVAGAGFAYVSDRHRLGPPSPVRELPVLERWGVPVGGGSYQRLLPRLGLRALLGSLGRSRQSDVLYYHSYDFGATLPRPADHRSAAVLKQVVARSRIPGIFSDLLEAAGSITCDEASRLAPSASVQGEQPRSADE